MPAEFPASTDPRTALASGARCARGRSSPPPDGARLQRDGIVPIQHGARSAVEHALGLPVFTMPGSAVRQRLIG